MVAKVHLLTRGQSGAVLLRSLAALMLGISFAGCSAAFQIQGNVVDVQNRPIAGASIDATRITGFSNLNQRFSAKSGDNGCFALAGSGSSIPTRQVSLTVSAPDYKNLTAAINTRSSNRVLITLVRKGSSAESSIVVPISKDGAFPCP